METLQYFKGTDRLEIREEKLFQMLDNLEKETTALFEEVLTTTTKDLEQLENLYTKYQDLSKKGQILKEAFDYLLKLESSSYDYAARRFQLKRVLTAMLTLFAFLSNALIGVVGFILLNDRAFKDYIKELVTINEALEQFETETITKIEITLSNCFRILKRKQKELGQENEKMKEIPISQKEPTPPQPQKEYEYIKKPTPYQKQHNS